MPGPAPRAVSIEGHARTRLKRLAKSQTAPHREVQRAQIIVLAAQGWDSKRVASAVGVSVRTVRRWRGRFAEDPRLVALRDRPRSGRRPSVPLAVRARLISLACERVGDDKAPFRTLWSYGSLQMALMFDTGVKISISEIGRILRNAAIRPHRVRMWLNSQDPDFPLKCKVVCGYYVAPPSDATVLCVDEKRLFAHERKPGLKPPGRHSCVRKEYEWSRHGSSVLLAAFDIRTGRVYGEVRATRKAHDLVEFLEEIAERVPGNVVIIWDNLNVHHNGKDDRWTAFNERHGGRFTFVYTPKHASWLNQVECWFSILERRVLRHGSFPDVLVVSDRVDRFITHWNDHEAHPFNWTFRGHFEPGSREDSHVRIRPRSHGGRLAA